jgi:hypothetical protein
MFRRACILPLAIGVCIAASCSGKPQEHYDANHTDRTFGFQMCKERRTTCNRAFDIVGYHGVSVLVWTKSKTWNLAPIGGKPNETPPPAAPLKRLNAAEGKVGDNQTNWYPLSRLRLVAADDAPLLSTSRGWPVVVCDNPAHIGLRCSLGMSVEGYFVEAHFTPSTGHIPNQRETWDLASSIDAAVRMRLPTELH